eukprot:TRINITY_DN15805_c0_g4_i1.p1 TRINITY_DN15805_c0_g4~~TRINITY_DN15805_c0_g4_i1.p1  ORF type:complete len:181 (+),score=8.40 TRINITY_DN15805_c0_g4_i1:230-772(+)
MATLLSKPEHHEQALTLFFHQHLPFEKVGYRLAEDGGRHPWAQQLWEDISALRQVEDFASFVDHVNGNIYMLLHDDSVRQQFAELDKTRLRRWWLLHSNHWPFPYQAEQLPNSQQDELLIDHESSEVVFRCEDAVADGSPCMLEFKSVAALQAHRRHSSLGGQHGQKHISSCIKRNECPF